MSARRLAAVVTAWLVAAGAHAARAQTNFDNQAWVSAEGRADVSKKLRLAVEQELRMGAQAGFDETFTDLEMAYRLAKPVRVAAHYRLIVTDQEAGTEIRHRVAGDLALTLRKKPVDFSWRLRLQATSRPGDSTLVPIRNRFLLGFLLPHGLEPYGAFEVFYMLSPVGEYRERRIYVGLSWAVTKRIGLEAFYLNLREANVSAPDAFNVLGAAMTVELYDGRGKEKEKERGGVTPGPGPGPEPGLEPEPNASDQ